MAFECSRSGWRYACDEALGGGGIRNVEVGLWQVVLEMALQKVNFACFYNYVRALII